MSKTRINHRSVTQGNMRHTASNLDNMETQGINVDVLDKMGETQTPTSRKSALKDKELDCNSAFR